MDKNEIIDRLERLARCAIHTEGELPFVMSLDDGIAIHEAIDMLRQSQQEPPWIPCSERLPEGKQEVLVTEYGDTDIGRRFEGRWLDRYGDKMKDVTAWMPKPEPYQGN